MKIEDSGKPEGSESEDGLYSDDDLACMLEHYIAAKDIEKDPKKLAMLKDYALSKNRKIGEIFDSNAPRESFGSLKKLGNKKAMEETEA